MEKHINGLTHLDKGFNISSLPKNKLALINEVYICPSFICNLQCPHCTLKNLPSILNLNNILFTIEYINEHSTNVYYDLFGGEPLLLDVDVLNKIHDKIKNKIYAVSTNLINYDRNKHLQLFKDAKTINVSWNPIRLNDEQYKTWLNNIKALQKDDIKVNLMITLTKDLIDNYTPEMMLNLLSIWKGYSIDFDYFIGKDDNNSDKISDWLLELYKIWNIPTHFNMVESIQNGILYNKKYKDCSNHYTILPSGNIKYGCAYWDTNVIKYNCLMCELYNFCNGGCFLETKCTFPKSLYYYIKERI